ncbi:sugar transferase [Subsaximicrobium wynnwilliamsii]|uniref:Sugar transferase n=1 Tax=Subsaximicrobium wynnwilliamsii TaxID=291179 RepID=A0A5C6ZE81_9FLAO|nr:sugar transferase [Subsaximicrobium wynnwilliamsii]TXD81675.1 sugar transferase [Subsaximicrobium wynnwilliamsii]TXD87430.1 sugar transferase [Subsaximicrobium wynnwilliamsii]TXE01118.1 sugar transferase [Subsaximicrobium wynnwilliamsii]
MGKKKNIHFEVSERKILLRLMDLFVVFFGLYCLELSSSFDYLQIRPDNWLALAVLAVYILAFGTVFEIYNLQKSSELDTVFRNIVLTVSVTVLFYMLTPVLTPFLPMNRFQILFFFLCMVFSLFVWRFAYINFVSSPRFYKKVLLVGEISNIENIVQPLRQMDPNYKIVGFINCETKTEASVNTTGLIEFEGHALLEVIKGEKVSEILIATYNSEIITTSIYRDLIHLLDRGFIIREYTQVYEELTRRVPIQFIGKDFYKFFPFSRSNQNTLYLFFHRLFDLIFSVIGLVFGLCLLPIVLIGNLMGNRGPVFYIQDRVGKNGKVFKIYKLRTMVTDAEVSGAKWAQKDDVRITRFGKFLRRSRLDEVPQFMNVLKAEMSIIGPRPERPFFVRELAGVVPFYETRHIVKPGLTGWAQVNTRYGASVDDSLTKLQYDLYYIKHRSLFLDLNIVVKTFSTIIYYRGQ